jgi:hypothetical protein
MFSIMSRWFEYIKARQIKVPPNFNVHSIINIIIKLFESSLIFGIIHAINFWYSFGDLFLPEINTMVIKIIIKYYFFKLYLHWSKRIRDIFHIFLVYKIIHQYEHSENQDIERVLWKVNINISSLKQSFLEYEQERFRWENKSKLDKRKKSIDKIKAELVTARNLQKILVKDIENNFPESKLFAITHLKHFEYNRNSIAFIEENQFNFQESEKVVKKIYNYQNILKNKKESTLEPENLAYCRYANDEFREWAQKYYSDLEKHGEKIEDLFPRMNLNVLMDEFELKDSDVSEW